MATELTGAQETAARALVESFERNGCLRQPNAERRKGESATYKMGYEVRLVAFSKAELGELRRAIRAAGLKPASPFLKVNRWIQPVYGRESMETFLAWVRKFGKKKTRKKSPAGKSRTARKSPARART